MKYYFVSNNQNKYKEVKKIIDNIELLTVDLPEIQSLDLIDVVKEKLKIALDYGKENIIVEDTALYLEALNGLPGPFVKWFLKTIGKEGIYQIADKFKNYRCKAKTLIGFAKNKNEFYFFEGETKGTIVAPRGMDNFGWDPIFLPEGIDKTYAEMSVEEKNRISHRSKAFKKFKAFLNEYSRK